MPSELVPGLNRYSTPNPPGTTPREFDQIYSRQDFDGKPWPYDSPVAGVYDVRNTTTNLITLNNKYREEFNKMRGYSIQAEERIIDPDRHFKARSPRCLFYHVRYYTSNWSLFPSEDKEPFHKETIRNITGGQKIRASLLVTGQKQPQSHGDASKMSQIKCRVSHEYHQKSHIATKSNWRRKQKRQASRPRSMVKHTATEKHTETKKLTEEEKSVAVLLINIKKTDEKTVSQLTLPGTVYGRQTTSMKDSARDNVISPLIASSMCFSLSTSSSARSSLSENSVASYYASSAALSESSLKCPSKESWSSEDEAEKLQEDRDDTMQTKQIYHKREGVDRPKTRLGRPECSDTEKWTDEEGSELSGISQESQSENKETIGEETDDALKSDKNKKQSSQCKRIGNWTLHQEQTSRPEVIENMIDTETHFDVEHEISMDQQEMTEVINERAISEVEQDTTPYSVDEDNTLKLSMKTSSPGSPICCEDIVSPILASSTPLSWNASSTSHRSQTLSALTSSCVSPSPTFSKSFNQNNVWVSSAEDIHDKLQDDEIETEVLQTEMNDYETCDGNHPNTRMGSPESSGIEKSHDEQTSTSFNSQDWLSKGIPNISSEETEDPFQFDDDASLIDMMVH